MDAQGSYGEECDDANRVDGDGCSLVCSIEDSHTCVGTPSVCTPRCGNGELDTFGTHQEVCDDGNDVSGDGCSSCVIDSLY